MILNMFLFYILIDANENRPDNDVPLGSVPVNENTAVLSTENPSNAENICTTNDETQSRNDLATQNQTNKNKASSSSKNQQENENIEVLSGTNVQIKKELNYLNAPDLILDISDDEKFDELRDTLAYDSDSDVDSEDELRKEFDHLISAGIVLPKAKVYKIEKNNESIAETNNTNDVVEESGAMGDNVNDVVLGYIPRTVDVSFIFD